MATVLFINACVRENSRTEKIALRYLAKINETYEEVDLDAIDFPHVDAKFLAWRDDKVAAGDFSDPRFDLAKQFARATKVVVAAPMWDLSFPAALKQYFEQVNVPGIVFHYGPNGPVSHCHAKSLTYITTSGGPHPDEDFGFGYVKALAKTFFGIEKTTLFQAGGFDIVGADEEELLKDAFSRVAEID